MCKIFLFFFKKKALQALKAPKQEPEPLVPLKRPMEAKDAKEMAKKLIKSGAIKVPEKPQPSTEKTTFKRSIVSIIFLNRFNCVNSIFVSN